jgi:hypothetical protein
MSSTVAEVDVFGFDAKAGTHGSISVYLPDDGGPDRPDFESIQPELVMNWLNERRIRDVQVCFYRKGNFEYQGKALLMPLNQPFVLGELWKRRGI